MAKKPPKAEMIKRAVELLELGTLPSNLPIHLMAEFDNLTPVKARKIAQAAIKIQKFKGED